MPSPADPTYTEAEVLGLVARDHPALGATRARHLSRGWDHDVFVVDEVWAFRFARHALAAAALPLEQLLLPRLASQLPAALPIIAWSGLIPGSSGLRYAGHRLLPGLSVCDAGWHAQPERRATLALPLARFLRALHAIDPSASGVPLAPEPLGRLDVARRGAPARLVLDGLQAEGRLTADVVDALHTQLDQSEHVPQPSEAPCFSHCDLHARNLLVEPESPVFSLAVIDWVDMCLAQPAIDLAVAFVLLPSYAREAFFAEYGPVSDPTRAWARWRAITFMTAAYSGAQARGHTGFGETCRTALRELATT
ncbi:MAG: phosphotransferase [Polyangiales bacterium]